jgi:hypothetical protein
MSSPRPSVSPDVRRVSAWANFNCVLRGQEQTLGCCLRLARLSHRGFGPGNERTVDHCSRVRTGIVIVPQDEVVTTTHDLCILGTAPVAPHDSRGTVGVCTRALRGLFGCWRFGCNSSDAPDLGMVHGAEIAHAGTRSSCAPTAGRSEKQEARDASIWLGSHRPLRRSFGSQVALKSDWNGGHQSPAGRSCFTRSRSR